VLRFDGTNVALSIEQAGDRPTAHRGSRLHALNFFSANDVLRRDRQGPRKAEPWEARDAPR
jgi:hypothetical protein